MQTLVARPHAPAPAYEDFARDGEPRLSIPIYLQAKGFREEPVLFLRMIFPEIVEIGGLLFRRDESDEAELRAGIDRWRRTGADDRQIETLINNVVLLDHFPDLSRAPDLLAELADGFRRGLESSLCELGPDWPCQVSLVDSEDGPQLTFWQIREGSSKDHP